MAAILCGGIGKCLEGVCTCSGNICKGSCELCGQCCKGFDKAISACCTSIGACCDGVFGICSSPFCLYVTVALIFNVPTIILGITEVTSLCRGSLWLLIAIVLCAIHIGAAMYVACRIQNKDDPKLADRSTASSRANYLFCYDPWMALYILVLVGFFVWLCVGIAWNISGSSTQDCANGDSINGKISTAIGLGFAYYVFGSCAMFCSCCCAQCDDRDYGSPGTPAPATYNNTNNNTNTQQQTTPGMYAQQQQQQQAYYPSQTRPDVENPAANQNYMYQQHQQQQQQAPPEPIVYSPNGVEVQADPSGVAYAEAMPMPAAGNPSYSTVKAGATAPPEPMMASAASAPPSQSTATAPPSSTGATVGSTMGKQLGKLFRMDEEKQATMQAQGQKAGDTVNKGFLSAKNYVTTQMNKQNTKKQPGHNVVVE